METIFLIKELREKGVAVKLVENQLEVSLLKENVEDEVVEIVRNNKEQIISYLQSISINKFKEIPKAKEALSYPVSNAQFRIWFESQSTAASTAYHIPFEVQLEGDYDRNLLEEAIRYVINRHEILRTVFRLNSDEEVQQHILSVEELNFSLAYQDFTAVEDSLYQVNQYIKEDLNISFDLENGPLLRAALLKYENNKYHFYCSLHHIICDAWSIPILKSEILTVYTALQTNKVPALQELRIQYKDYTVWSLENLKGESSLKQKTYWLDKLSTETPILELPVTSTRPSVKTYNGQTLKTYFNTNISNAVNAYQKSNEGSLYMVMLTTLHIMLAKYSRTKDTIIGSPFAAREHMDLNNQIGFYTNTLAIRNRIEQSDSFDTFFAAVKQSVLEAHNNQQYPFEEVVRDLNLKKDASRNPLFDVMLVVLPKEGAKNSEQFDSEASLDTITVEKNTTSKFDLLVYVEETENDLLSLKVEYNTDLFEEKFIAQFITHYKNLVHLLLTQHTERIGALNYLTENESVLKQEAETEKYLKNCVIEFFENQVKRTPENVAVQYEDISLTYKEVNEYTNQLAHCLREKYNVTPQTNVGVILGRSHLNVLAMIGVIKAGGCYVPIDHKYNVERKKYILDDAEIKTVVSTTDLFDEELSEKAALINLDQFVFSEWNGSNLNIVNQLDDPSFVIYTSGSTGHPKGVVQTHRMLSNLIQWNIYDSGIEAGLRHLQYTSFSFDVSLQDCWFVLSSGGILFITPESLKTDFSMLLDYIVVNAIEVLCFPFSALTNFFDFPKETLVKNHKIKHIISSGEQLLVNSTLQEFLVQNPKVKLHNHYGPSETHVVTSFTMSSEESEIVTYAPIGKPVANTTVYILDKDQQPVPKKVIGEIYIGGEHVAHGYLNLPDLTNELFIANPFEKNERLYKTGDLAYEDYTGNIIYLGRNDNQVKIRGYRIELEEIKNVILVQEHISQAFVDVVNKENEQLIVAYIVTNEPIDRLHLKKQLSKVLLDYMLPSHIILLDEIPLTSNGKIDKKALPEIDDHALVTAQYTAPETIIEKQLAEIWKNLLGVDKIGIHDNFFELGGHSLRMHKLLNQIKSELATEISFELFLSNPTIESVALHIENLKSLQNPVTLTEKKKILI
ncbi:non-ribosomal peptide synthetase [Flavobacterium poyangense]|uniref:non-ribosomal peptide synthetase n=1 Tax=Flavobacterium poyangense TaxID=2204302 RepID=UPI001421E5D5|nr:non-ribosomal peptide synthetase [Flavobacterium sp. JXAS1]